MKRPVNEVIGVLNELPLDAKVDVFNVWSNGTKIRRYSGQDVQYAKDARNIVRTAPTKGYHRMIAILIEDGEDA